MTRKVLAPACIAASVILTNVFLPGASTLYAGIPGENREKTVEQVRKNIQALKGLPASQLNTVMDFMATSLGVRCQHCHVADSTGWQFEKDDKPTKRTARKMIQMVVDLNASRFGGRTDVTCYTCHRGSTERAPAPAYATGADTRHGDPNTSRSNRNHHRASRCHHQLNELVSNL